MKTIFDRVLLLLDGVALALCGLALVDFVLHPLAGDFIYHSVAYRAVSMLVLTPLTLGVGFLIIRRVPGNAVGPLLVAWSGTVVYGAIRKDIGPVPSALFAFYEITFGWYALFLMVLLFPDGKVYPPGAARWVHRLVGLGLIANSLLYFSNPSLPGDVPNPFHWSALDRPKGLIPSASLLFGLPILALLLISPVLRYRQGSRLERQQIKWLALFGVLLAAASLLGFVVYPALTGRAIMNREDNLFSIVFFFSTGLLPPLTIGVAVLRYRLWDIDLLIRRTLIYSLLTGLLALAYFSSVVILENGLRVFAIRSQSQFVAVVSTLAIAALFTPLRGRVQAFIDRRFYRRKYDAARVLAQFGASVRDEVDLEALTQRLTGVVQDAMQPASVGLWLADTQGKSR